MGKKVFIVMIYTACVYLIINIFLIFLIPKGQGVSSNILIWNFITMMIYGLTAFSLILYRFKHKKDIKRLSADFVYAVLCGFGYVLILYNAPHGYHTFFFANEPAPYHSDQIMNGFLIIIITQVLYASYHALRHAIYHT